MRMGDEYFVLSACFLTRFCFYLTEIYILDIYIYSHLPDVKHKCNTYTYPPAFIVILTLHHPEGEKKLSEVEQQSFLTSFFLEFLGFRTELGYIWLLLTPVAFVIAWSPVQALNICMFYIRKRPATIGWCNFHVFEEEYELVQLFWVHDTHCFLLIVIHFVCFYWKIRTKPM